MANRARRVFEVVAEGRYWRVTTGGTERTILLSKTQGDAFERACTLARRLAPARVCLRHGDGRVLDQLDFD